MSAKKSVVKNYIYNLIYQLFLIVVPIITTPYISRVLGDEGSGQYSYISSIVSYFTLFAALGFGQYAQRLIARCQGDRYEQSKAFWEVIIARLVPAILSVVVYLVLFWGGVYEEKYSQLVIIMTINVVAVMFDISFFFQGNEEFGKIVIRSVIVKLISVICIFVFVKNESDLWKYTLIQSLSIIVGYLILWLYMPGLLVRIKLKELSPFKHILPTLVLFLPTIATSVYVTLDKTLIGIITKNDSENGNYEYAERIVKLAMTVITSLGTVMIPRNSQQFAIGDIEGIKKNIYSSLQFVFFLGIPIMFGIAAIADNLVPWYLGSEYDKAANIMKILSPIVMIIGISNVFGLQFLVPSGQDKKFTLSVVAGAITNFLLNCVLIRFWASYGAAIATVIAETVVTVVMYMYVKRYISFGKIVKASWKYILSGVLMFVMCMILGLHLGPSIKNTFIVVFFGGVFYIVLLLVMRDQYLYCVLKKFLKRGV